MSIRQAQIQSLVRYFTFGQTSQIPTTTSTQGQADPTAAFSSLSLNSPGTQNGHSDSSSSPYQWKILVYDSVGSAIIGPVLTTKQLASLGVTLPLHLNQVTDAIPDTPCIYFLEPTRSNLQQIVQHMQRQLYNGYYLYFTSPLPRTELEWLATATLQAGTSQQIQKVYDTYLNFVCLDDHLVTFNHQHSYQQINDANATEQQVMSLIDATVDQLFYVCVTLRMIPIIKCRPGEAAEQIARRLDTKLREHLLSRNNLFSTGTTGAATFAGIGGSPAFMQHTRPLLILLDRTMDLNTPLLHTWTYEALLNDIFNAQNNFVTVPATEDSGIDVKKAYKTHSYTLSSQDDSFWRRHQHSEFHEVSASVVTKQQNYMKEVQSIQQRTGTTIDASQPAATVYDPNAASSQLAETLNVLPRMQRLKRQLDCHMNLATALLKTIQSRDLDLYYRTEMQWLSQRQTDKNELWKLVSADSTSNSTKGQFIDQLRAFIIYYLSQESANESLLTQVKASLQSVAVTDSDRKLLAALEYIKEYKFFHKLGSDVAAGISTSASSGTSGLSSVAGSTGASGSASIFDTLASKAIDIGSEWMNSAKQLLPTNNNLPVTRIVDKLIYNRDHADVNKYFYFDPKQLKQKGPINVPHGQSSEASGGLSTGTSHVAQNTIVFMVGGGCYAEHQNLQAYAASHSERGVQSITYGCTQLNSPLQFLQQLADLGMKKAGSIPVD